MLNKELSSNLPEMDNPELDDAEHIVFDDLSDLELEARISKGGGYNC